MNSVLSTVSMCGHSSSSLMTLNILYFRTENTMGIRYNDKTQDAVQED